MSKKHLFLVGLLVAVIVPVATFGATIKGGEEITIGEGEVVRDNLYVAGGKIFIGESVYGDVLAAGGDIVVSKDIAEDITIAGGSISVLGSSGGDIRIAGGDILLTGSMVGDLIIVGGAIDVLPEVVVGRDAVIAGGAVSLNGTVKGDTKITGGRVDIVGNIRGNLTVEAEEINIKSSANIGGSIVYKGKDETILTVEEGATITGATVYEEGKLSGFADRGALKHKLFAVFGTLLLMKLATFIVIGLLGVIYFKRFSRSVVRGALEHKGRAFVWGVLTLIVTPVLIGVLFASLVGSLLAFMLILTYVLLIITSGVYAGVILGSWIGKVLQKEEHGFIVDWKYAILGIVALFVVAFIPIIGWLAVLYLFLLSLGSISNELYKNTWLNR